MTVTFTAFPKGSYLHSIHKQMSGCVVKHRLATQTTRVPSPHWTQSFSLFILLPFFRHAQDDFSLTTIDARIPAKRTLFNAIPLKLECLISAIISIMFTKCKSCLSEIKVQEDNHFMSSVPERHLSIQQ